MSDDENDLYKIVPNYQEKKRNCEESLNISTTVFDGK